MYSIYTNEELKILERLALDIFGMHFIQLGFMEQDDLYLYAEDMNLIDHGID